MAYRERQLSRAEIAQILAQSDSEDSGDESEVEDCVAELRVSSGEESEDSAPEESDAEVADSTPARGRVFATATRKLTVSEKTLADADLQTFQEQQQTYSVQRKKQEIIQWISQPANLRKRKGKANSTKVPSGLKGKDAKKSRLRERRSACT